MLLQGHFTNRLVAWVIIMMQRQVLSKCLISSVKMCCRFFFAVGPFQSDALLVPDHCVFDHVHEPKLCTSYRTWNDTATAACVNRGMSLLSFSMLKPCGIDRFNGVEFVCCPHRATAATSKSLGDSVTVFNNCSQ